MKKVFDLLERNCITTLATCSNDKPRASVVEYHVVGDAIIFATLPGSIKAHNLKENKRISLSVNNHPIFVTIDGVVTMPTQAEIDGYHKKLFELHPELKKEIEKGITKEPFVHFKVVVEAAYYSDYTNGIVPAEIIKA